MTRDGPETIGRRFARRFLERPGTDARSPELLALLLDSEIGWTEDYRLLPLFDRLRFRSAAERELRRILRTL